MKKEYNYEKMDKRNEEAISEFNYEYYYCQLTIEKPLWYFELYPNEDLANKIKFDNKAIEWISCHIML